MDHAEHLCASGKVRKEVQPHMHTCTQRNTYTPAGPSPVNEAEVKMAVPTLFTKIPTSNADNSFGLYLSPEKIEFL